MTNEPNKDPNSASQQSARTDDLLASGSDAQDGARGFSGAQPEALQTGMEGIAGSTMQQGNRQSESNIAGSTNQTVPDKSGPVQNKG